MKLLTCCTSCGYRLGRSGDGTQTETTCPKCGAVIDYTVSDTTVTVRVIKPSAKLRQAERVKKYQEKIEE